MVKAHSLLYAIYICLIVSVICYALLFFSSLYTQLNLHYNLHEELYLHNQSSVNFALGDGNKAGEIPQDPQNAINGNYAIKPFGLLELLTVSSVLRQDTVSSVQFIGNNSPAKIAIHLSGVSRPLSYAGNVLIKGQSFLPSVYIESAFLSNFNNDLNVQGKISQSDVRLPELNPLFKKMFESQQILSASQTALVHNDSANFNSFRMPTKKVAIPKNLANKVFKGNFILYSQDSVFVRKSTLLNDVILMAPVVIFEEGFTGNLQVFATRNISLGKKVVLNYPSSLCLFNDTDQTATIQADAQCSVSGAIVLFGNELQHLDKNSIEIAPDGIFLADIYCTGKFMSKSNIQGSVFTNRFFYKTENSVYENLICNINVDITARPENFVAFPLFETPKTQPNVIKRLL